MHPEIEHYLHMIADLRGEVIDLVTDLPAEALNWRPLEGDDHATNSLAVMAMHVAGAEHFWMAEVIGGYPPSRDRPAEFETVASGPQPLVERLQAVGAETEAVLGSLDAAALAGTRRAWDRDVSVRWGILHVIDHTALHLGHMQITYQLWQGGRAKHMPRWFERAPGAEGGPAGSD